MVDGLVGHITRIVLFKQPDHIVSGQFPWVTQAYKIGFAFRKYAVHRLRQLFFAHFIVICDGEVVVSRSAMLAPILATVTVGIVKIPTLSYEN